MNQKDINRGRAILIVNTKSRRGRELHAEALERLQILGLDVVEGGPYRNIRQVKAGAAKAVKERTPLVIVGGGDGTFSAIARYFVNSESVMGVLPLGTGNQFARDLQIPSDLQAACEIIAKGQVVPVDMGTAANDYFLNVATIGVTTQIAKSLTGESKRRLGRLVYAFALVRALQNTKPFRVEIDTENGYADFETLQVVIGNGRYHAGPFPISPTASITEGKLSLYALHTTSRASFLKLGLYLPTGRHVDLPEVHSQDTVGGTIRTHPALATTIDGEISAHTPLKFGILPNGLKVVVPQTFTG